MTYSMDKLIIASNNKHKIEEIKSILGDFCPHILSLKEAGIDIDIDENGNSFEENAYIKSKAILDLTGEAALADDSGLEVYALNGEPGIFSARYAGEHGNDKANNNKLINELESVPDNKRGGRFVSAIVLLIPDGKRFTAMGYVEGILGHEERGNNGFGYDPLFIVPELGRTYAELTSEEKNSISHRSRALQELKRQLSGK